jgi:hypothetical protein
MVDTTDYTMLENGMVDTTDYTMLKLRSPKKKWSKKLCND